MIRKIVSGLVFCGLSSIALAEVAASQEGQGLYAVRNSWLNFNADLGDRISLANKDYIFLHLLGASEPYLVGLSLKEFRPKLPAENHIRKDQVIAFRIGKRIDAWKAEILAHDTDSRVGTAIYSTNEDWDKPARVEELCSGAFETACSIGFDAAKKRFALTIFEVIPPDTEAPVCR